MADMKGMQAFVSEQIYCLFDDRDISKEDMDYADSRLEEITEKYLKGCDIWEAANSESIPLSKELGILHAIIHDTIKERNANRADISKTIKKLKDDLEQVFESGKLKLAGKRLTPSVVYELYDFVVSKDPAAFSTISQDVYDVLSAYGVNLQSSGIGWKVCMDVTSLNKSSEARKSLSEKINDANTVSSEQQHSTQKNIRIPERE